MEIVNFSENWNNKLDCKYFTTIRKGYNYRVGETYIIAVGNDPKGKAKLIEKCEVSFETLRTTIFGLMLLAFDTGYYGEKAVKLFNNFGIADDTDVTVLLFEMEDD